MGAGREMQNTSAVKFSNGWKCQSSGIEGKEALGEGRKVRIEKKTKRVTAG